MSIAPPTFTPISPEEQARRDAEAKRDAERKRKREVDQIITAAHLPLRHTLKHKDGVDRSGPWGQELERIKARVSDGIMCALVGGRGPGKTQMAVSISIECAWQDISSLYCTATEMLMAFKSAYKSESKETEESVMLRFKRPTLLIVDEMDKRASTDWEQRLIFELLDRRYRDMRSTIIISNQTAKEFADSIGPSLASRMTEAGGIIECNWQSFRH